MFKFLSLFIRNSDEPLNDNEYDLLESEKSVGVTGETKPVIVEKLPVAPTENPPLPILTGKARAAQVESDEERLSVIKNELRDISDNPHSSSGEQDITASEDAKAQNNALRAPDLSLIHGYGHPDDEGQHIPLGIMRFQKGRKVLDFLAVEHVAELAYPTPIHRAVDTVINSGDPEEVITEGHSTDMTEARRKGIIQWTKERVERVEPNNNGIPEAGYAAYLADERGIPSIGGEITGPDFLRRMQAHGYSAEDVLAVEFMRYLGGDEELRLAGRETMTEDEFVTRHAQRIVNKVNGRFNPQQRSDIEPYTFDKFKKWFDTKRPLGDRSFLGVNNSDFVPRQQGEYVNKINCVSGVVRDEHIAELISNLLKEKDRVTIVYGNGHLNSLRPLLVNMFDDEGTFTSLEDKDIENFQIIRTEEVDKRTGEKYIYLKMSKPYKEPNKYTYIDGQYFPDSHKAFLEYVVVNSDERNQGTGRQLFNFFIKETQKMGANTFYGSIANAHLLKWCEETFKGNRFYTYKNVKEDVRFTPQYEISEAEAKLAISRGEQVDVISQDPHI